VGTLGITGQARAFEPFRVGAALGDAFGIMARHLPSFLGISAVANIPNIYIYYHLYNHLWLSRGSGVLGYTLLEMASQCFIGALAQASLLYATFQHLRGRPVNMFESIGRGFARFLPVMLTSITVTAIVFAGKPTIILSIMASAGLVAAMPACIVERLGPFKSVSRSFSLTNGYKGGIFGALVAIGIVNLIVATVVTLVFGGPAGSPPLFALALFVWATLVTCYLAVVSAIIYHGLRITKEGVDLEQIASVFD